jgi:hypothetical protein
MLPARTFPQEYPKSHGEGPVTVNSMATNEGPEGQMLVADALLRLQQEQFRHDQRNHSDIHCLPKSDRLKHYGLHFAKYVGRLARGSAEEKAMARTIVDAMLVSLSAANTLHHRLHHVGAARDLPVQVDPLRPFADAVGRFADACEKFDHAEEYGPMAREAVDDIVHWLITTARDREITLLTAIQQRRKELAERAFFIAGEQ